MQPLEERIADIEKLDGLRRRARTLREQAIAAVTGKDYLPRPRAKADRAGWDAGAGRDGWRLPGDDVEKAMMLQALLTLDAKEDTRTQNQRLRIRNDLLAITVADCDKTEDAHPDEALDNVPIMRCAMVLHALKMDGRALTSAALACLYRIVLELSEVADPTWSAGAARASAQALASAFVTGECVLALLAVETAMLHTAEAADVIADTKRRVAELGSEVVVWREQELASCAMALYASLNALRPHLQVALPDDLLSSLRHLGQKRTDVASELNPLLNQLETALSAALDSIPTAAAILPAALGFDATSGDSIETIVASALKAAAHSAAQLIVTKLLDTLKAPPAASISPLAQVASNLRDGARLIHDLVRPVTHFAESTVDRELAAPELGLVVDAAELVFGACLLGRLTDWRQPKVRSAFQLARRVLTPNGRLPSFQPFNIRSQGYRLNVATIETTRRLAELAAHVEVETDPAFVETLMRPFEDTRAPGQAINRGWMTDPRGRDALSEWWVTALAVDALGIVINMLNEQINRQVLEQFHVRGPMEIGLNLGQLFFPDFGLTALRSNRLGWDRSVAVKLQELRVHAGHGPGETTPRYSLILYGPPGTGKTTLVEAIAKSANVPLVEITPSDILVGGQEAIERRTRHVFLALSMLTNVVILFDEFDPILQDRAKRTGDEQPTSIFEFLTPGMLPKLKQLHESAKKYRVSYVLATNFVYNLDPAVTRQGRFDDRHGIYPPDAVSRLGRLTDQLRRQSIRLDEPAKARALSAVVETAGGALDQIGRPGWYSAGRASGSMLDYIIHDHAMDPVRREANYNKQWPEFISRKIGSALTPRNFRENMSPEEQWYWDDWSTILFWEEKLSDAVQTGVKFDAIGGLLDRWVQDRIAREAELTT